MCINSDCRTLFKLEVLSINYKLTTAGVKESVPRKVGNKLSDKSNLRGFELYFLILIKLQTNNKQKNHLVYLLVVGVYLSPIEKIDSGQTRLELYNERQKQVVKDRHANHHQTEPKVISLSVVQLYLYKYCRPKLHLYYFLR